jgi:hypothetical protein
MISQAGDGLRERREDWPFSRRNDVTWQMGMKIAGQVPLPQGHDPSNRQRVGSRRSATASAPAGLCGPSKSMAGPEQLG